MKLQVRGANPLVKSVGLLGWQQNPDILNSNKCIRMKTALDLKGIAQVGGNLVVDALSYTALDLKGVASVLNKGTTLTIKHADKFTALDCKGIAAAAPGQVIFDFS